MQVLETIQTNIAFSSLLKRYTLEEFWDLPEPDDRSHYELIEGVLHIVPPPANPHGKIIAFLTKSLVIHNFNIDNLGTVYHPREAIYLKHWYGEAKRRIEIKSGKGRVSGITLAKKPCQFAG